MFENDICFCGNAKNCPSKDYCKRAEIKTGIHTYSNFYKENKECEYFIRNEVYNENQLKNGR